MHHKLTPQVLAGALAILAAASLTPSAHAVAAPPLTYSTMGQFNFVFDASKLAPNPAGKPGVLDFLFTPAAGSPAPAMVTIGGLYFSSDWNVPLSSLSSPTTHGNAVLTLNPLDFLAPAGGPYSSTIAFQNNDGTGTTFAPAELLINATTIGSTGGFNLKYADPPGTGSSTFSMLINGIQVFSTTIAPGGQATVLSETPGTSVTATPGTGTPTVIQPLAPPPGVPEASDMALLGLGVLPLFGLVRARRRAAQA